MPTTIYALASVIIVSLISFVGLLSLSVKADQLRKFLMYMVSFAAGAMFGDVFIHLLPELFEDGGFGIMMSVNILIGILVLFVVEKIIRWRHCHHGPDEHGHIHPYAVINIFGDGVHNFLDGLIIGASYLVSVPVGLATTIAVILHEIPQEIGDYGILLHGGFTKRKALFINFATAFTAIFGAAAALILSSYADNVTSFLVPFAAGGFIYIAGSDLIPELHKEVETKKSIFQFLVFLAGIGIMLSLLFLK